MNLNGDTNVNLKLIDAMHLTFLEGSIFMQVPFVQTNEKKKSGCFFFNSLIVLGWARNNE